MFASVFKLYSFIQHNYRAHQTYALQFLNKKNNKQNRDYKCTMAFSMVLIVPLQFCLICFLIDRIFGLLGILPAFAIFFIKRKL